MPRSSGPPSRGPAWRRPLALAVEIGLLLRVLAADLVQWRLDRAGDGRVCLLPDSEYYWRLAQTIRDGEVFQIVEWGDVPHFALRTPGYPLFLAACRLATGDNPLGARLIQAALGAACVWLVYRLTIATLGEDRRSAALVAAALTAVHPYFIATSALLLTEAVFVPLLLVFLWAAAVLWDRQSARGAVAPGLAAGGAAAAAVLVRPSCLLFFPMVVAAWWASRLAARRAPGPVLVGTLAMALAFVATMAPWWVRNARVYGEFVPTALWMGASLYDGLNPDATGGSDMMRFLADPDVWPLDERDQDRRLKARAVAFARENPGRVASLAVVKLGRYWSPWPNAEAAGPAWVRIAAGAVMTPLLVLMAFGLWTLHRDARAWALLAGPILYFAAVHAVFASSMRYRTPGEFPAMATAAVGLLRAAGDPRRGVDRRT